MEYILALTLSAIFTVIFIAFKKKNSGISKPKIVKKHEIIDNYKKELFEILEASENDKNLQMQERIKFLKKVNYELSMNIFFEKDELKNFILELSKLEKR